MPHCSIHQNTNPNTKEFYPYLINIQSSFFDVLDTRLVVPLSSASNFNDHPIKDLNPVLNFNGVEYVVLTQQMAAIRSKNLGKQVGDASAIRKEMLAAIDLLITGF